MIPASWTIAKLEQVAPITDCKHRTPVYTEIGVPIVSPGNISWGSLRLDDCRRISEAEFEAMMDHCQVDQGDLVFGRNQTVGVAARVCSDAMFALGQDTVLIKPRRIDSYFLQNYLQSEEARRQIYRLLGGSTFGRINLRDLREFSVPLPPREEQSRIAEILSTWDRAIEATERLIANSQAQKKALMQQLLTGKKRLPGFSGEWRMKKLSEFCTVRRGASPRPIDSPKWFAEAGRGWVRISDVTKSPDERLQRTEQYLSSEGAANSVSVDPGDLIMSICATIGVPKFVGIPACIHDGFVVFRDVAPSLELSFLFYVLEAATERLANSGQPGTQKNLNTSIVSAILVPDIAVDEQLAIAERLKTADCSLRALAEELKILKTEKSALMQQLLTGKRRVKLPSAQKETAVA
jgi:type I restriction enzyme S subunit